MKAKDMVKKVIDDDFDRDENYTSLIEKLGNDKGIRSRRQTLSLIACSLLLVCSLIYFNSTKQPGSNEDDDSYFFTAVYADNTEYNLEDETQIKFYAASSNRIEKFYSIPYEYSEYSIYFLTGIKLDFSIDGDNVDKIIYKVNSKDGLTTMYRGVSGELDNRDDLKTTGKWLEDLSMEDKQIFLDTIGKADIKAEDLSDKEFSNLYYSNGNDSLFLGKLDALDEAERNQRFSHFIWDLIKNDNLIEVPKNEQSDRYAIFLGRLLSDDLLNELEDITTSTHYPTTSDDFKALSEDTSVTIDIVYKNGITHTKTLTFNLIEKGTEEFEYFDLECVIR